MNEVSRDDSTNAKLVYILYLVAIVVGITAIVGVVMAYINRKDAPDWLKTHYTFQIRTFWIGLLIGFIGIITTFILVGFLIILFYIVWLIIRCVNGMNYLGKGEAIPNPETWLFK